LALALIFVRYLSPYFNLGLDLGTPEPTSVDGKDLDDDNLLSEQIINDGSYAGLYPSWGTTRILAVQYDKEGHLVTIADTEVDKDQLPEHNKAAQALQHKEHIAHSEAKITLAPSVSIAGCDLLSSCLYTAGTCASYAGKLAPIGLILVSLMLMFFRHVYSEVVSCLPINGGTYNSILNTTSKKFAAMAGILSILSYVATSIISAYESMVYLEIIWPGVDVRGGTIICLAFFLMVTSFGVKESANVSFVLLAFHLAIMTLLMVWGFAHGCADGFQTFKENMYTPQKTIVDQDGKVLVSESYKVIGAIFYGYCSALLGITGFESAANYVEALKSPRTFVKTVNWLWRLVAFYNPGLSIIVMMVLPMEEIYAHPGELLAIMGEKLGGQSLATAVCVDAVLILAGAVLTSFVGVSGLLVRLARDKVIPDVVGWETSQGVPIVANFVFFAISASLFLVLFDPHDEAQIAAFGGVYAIAFLCVLTAFACSAVLVKLNRGNMARLVIARWWQIWLSLFCVLAGLVGNITLTPRVFVLFIIYVVAFGSVCGFMFLRVDVYSFAIWMVSSELNIILYCCLSHATFHCS
jgi:amino acid transporter